MNSSIYDRLRACAVGAAIGDALGMPLEFTPPRHPDNFVTEMQPARLPAGSFTDDTEMAIALGESLIHQKPLDGEDLGQRFVAWYRSNPPDVGIHTANVLGRIAGGESWAEAAKQVQKSKPESAGNGSVMRCWPIAVAWWNNRRQLIADSRLQSMVTHPHQDCLCGCVLINLMISELAKGAAPPDAFAAALDESAAPSALRGMLVEAPQRSRQELKNSGWVRHTLESALWGLLTTDSFQDAVIQVVNLGNDADSAGAVVGALAGAAYGMEAVPAGWLDQLQGEWPPGTARRWHTGDILSLVDQLM